MTSGCCLGAYAGSRPVIRASAYRPIRSGYPPIVLPPSPKAVYSAPMDGDVPQNLQAALADRFDLKRVLGRGGMATVYLGYDRRHRRDVAVKVLRPDLAASIGVDRFLHEIQIAARLNHPNILALHDSGEASGFLYYVMPYIDGASLRERLLADRR